MNRELERVRIGLCQAPRLVRILDSHALSIDGEVRGIGTRERGDGRCHFVILFTFKTLNSTVAQKKADDIPPARGPALGERISKHRGLEPRTIKQWELEIWPRLLRD